MANYLIIPEISSDYVKFGMTEKGYADVASYLYRRYRTPYGRNLIIYIWCNADYLANEKVVLSKFKHALCEKSEIIKICDVSVNDIISFCENIINTDTLIYSMGVINLSKGYGQVLRAHRDSQYKKELYEKISREIREKRERNITKAIQKEFDIQWDMFINKEQRMIDTAKKEEEQRKLLEEKAITDKKLKKLAETKDKTAKEMLELEKKAELLAKSLS